MVGWWTIVTVSASAVDTLGRFVIVCVIGMTLYRQGVTVLSYLFVMIPLAIYVLVPLFTTLEEMDVRMPVQIYERRIRKRR